MQKIMVMVGIPGSGKSVKAREFIKSGEYDAIISSDEIRKEILGSEEDQSNNELVFRKYYAKLNVLLREGKNIVLDATNLTRKSRSRVFECAQSYDGPVKIYAWVMNVDYDECIARDKARQRTVGADVILKMVSRYENPHKFEGFTEVFYENLPNFGNISLDTRTTFVNAMDVFDQENHHHAYTVGGHCEHLAELCTDPLLIEAGRFHDIGKVYTKPYGSDGEAHYYSHANVGAYILVTHLEMLWVNNKDDIDRLLFIVNHHMLAHDINTPKTEEKYREMFGDKLFEELMLFKKYDRIACGTLTQKEIEEL